MEDQGQRSMSVGKVCALLNTLLVLFLLSTFFTSKRWTLAASSHSCTTKASIYNTLTICVRGPWTAASETVYSIDMECNRNASDMLLVRVFKRKRCKRFLLSFRMCVVVATRLVGLTAAVVTRPKNIPQKQALHDSRIKS